MTLYPRQLTVPSVLRCAACASLFLLASPIHASPKSEVQTFFEDFANTCLASGLKKSSVLEAWQSYAKAEDALSEVALQPDIKRLEEDFVRADQNNLGATRPMVDVSKGNRHFGYTTNGTLIYTFWADMIGGTDFFETCRIEAGLFPEVMGLQDAIEKEFQLKKPELAINFAGVAVSERFPEFEVLFVVLPQEFSNEAFITLTSRRIRTN